MKQAQWIRRADYVATNDDIGGDVLGVLGTVVVSNEFQTPVIVGCGPVEARVEPIRSPRLRLRSILAENVPVATTLDNPAVSHVPLGTR